MVIQHLADTSIFTWLWKARVHFLFTAFTVKWNIALALESHSWEGCTFPAILTRIGRTWTALISIAVGRLLRTGEVSGICVEYRLEFNRIRTRTHGHTVVEVFGTEKVLQPPQVTIAMQWILAQGSEIVPTKMRRKGRVTKWVRKKWLTSYSFDLNPEKCRSLM